jgi:hypothetical protein
VQVCCNPSPRPAPTRRPYPGPTPSKDQCLAYKTNNSIPIVDKPIQSEKIFN